MFLTRIFFGIVMFRRGGLGVLSRLGFGSDPGVPLELWHAPGNVQ